MVVYLEVEDQMTELEHGLQIQLNADLMNSCRRHSALVTHGMDLLYNHYLCTITRFQKHRTAYSF